MNRALLIVTLVTAFGIGCKKSEPDRAASTDTAKPAPTAVVPPTASAPTPVPAGEGDPWSKLPPAKDPLPKPLLWSVEKDGTTSYMLGTIHKGVDAETRLPQIVFDKLDASPAFAMETDLASAGPAMQKIIECVGCSLKRELTAAQYAKLEDALGKATVDKIQSMKPMVAATMLAMQFMPETAAMDGVLQGRAQRLNKKMVYLEDAADAAKVLSRWMDVRALRLMLDHLDDGKKQMAEMLAAYVAGDEKKLLTINDSEKEKALKVYTQAEYAQQQADILYSRNAAWLPAIEKMHAEGGGFIAVGALHLVGPKSVPELLEGKGYKITRIP
ncbi:MAG: TraB/GumN family protein [Kofleriaceae bacterium]